MVTGRVGTSPLAIGWRENWRALLLIPDAIGHRARQGRMYYI
jgi:hypothetical protein